MSVTELLTLIRPQNSSTNIRIYRNKSIRSGPFARDSTQSLGGPPRSRMASEISIWLFNALNGRLGRRNTALLAEPAGSPHDEQTKAFDNLEAVSNIKIHILLCLALYHRTGPPEASDTLHNTAMAMLRKLPNI
ncbi:hypothetical protein PM082_018582 [Marasmius tenuissimus]|nr:hypothetical protein PM082_018582 [Marasmius tenuissimus]